MSVCNNDMSEQKGSSMRDWVLPIFQFWKKGIVQRSPWSSATPINEEVKQNITAQTMKRTHYTATSRNDELLQLVLRIAQSKGSLYTFTPKKWNWHLIQGAAELAFSDKWANLYKLPSFSLSTELYQDVVLDLEDGGVTCMHLYYPRSIIHRTHPTTPTLLIFPSLTSNQNAFKHLIHYATEQRGWSVAVMNRRGLCEKLVTPQFYVAGSDADVLAQITHLRTKIPYFKSRPFVCISISMGGNVLMRYLSHFHTQHDRDFDGIVAGASICSPVHPRDVRQTLGILTSHLTSVVSEKYVRPYLKYFEQDHLKPITRNRLLQPDQVETVLRNMRYWRGIFLELSKCNNIFELMFKHMQLSEDEETFNARLQTLMKKWNWGQQAFSELVRLNDERVWDAFPEYNITDLLPCINVPFLAICAADDPLVSLSVRSRDALLAGSHTTYLLTAAGQHCYPTTRLDISSPGYAESVALAYFDNILVK